ncbi:MAG: hypothetical protein J6T46_01970, partial [Victivallales bacterium]|nr:hypothetical protein [Victivallales bacterium]
EALEEALNDYQGTLCSVSHDISFVSNLATTIFELTPGKITRYYGNYDYYRQKLAEQQAKLAEDGSTASQQKPNAPKNAPQAAKPQDAPNVINSRKDRKREEAFIRNQFSAEKRKYEKAVEATEKKSESLEAEQAQIFSDMANAKPGLDFAALNKRLAEIKKELEDTVWEWDEASRKLEDVNKRCEAKLAALK